MSSSSLEQGSEWGEPRDLLSRFEPNCITTLGNYGLYEGAAEYQHVPILSDAVTIALARGLSPGGLFAAFLTGISAAIPNFVRLQVDPERHSDWFEPPCFWALLIAPPSSNKSLYHKLATAPLVKHHDDLVASSTAAMAAYANARPKGSRGPLPPCRRLIIDDVTAPALRDLLSDNPNRLLISSEEASSLVGMPLSSRGIYNRAFNGEPQRADRRSVNSTQISGACLSMLLSSHPDVVRQAASQPIHDGFWQRFIPIEIEIREPQCKYSAVVGTTNYQLVVDAAMASDTVLSQMYSFASPSSSAGETVLRFSSDGQAAFDRCRAIIKELAKTGVINPALGSHIGKLDKIVARIALILHFASKNWMRSRGNNDHMHLINADTVNLSHCIVTEYFLPQVYAFYSEYFGVIGTENTKSAALEILSRNLKRFSASDLKRPKSYDDAVKSLQAFNWIRPIKMYSRTFEVNPAVFSMDRHRHADLIAKQAESHDMIRRITQFGKFS